METHAMPTLVLVIADEVVDTGRMGLGFATTAHVPSVYLNGLTFLGQLYKRVSPRSSYWEYKVTDRVTLTQKNGHAGEVRLHNLLEEIPSCILLVSQTDFQKIEQAAAIAAVRIEAYRYNGALATN